jgi:cystathionine gamma-lyase
LPSHPQFEIGKKQMRGFGGMISFYVKGGSKEAIDFLKALKASRSSII